MRFSFHKRPHNKTIEERRKKNDSDKYTSIHTISIGIDHVEQYLIAYGNIRL